MPLLSDVVPHHVRPDRGNAVLEPPFEFCRRNWIPAHMRPPKAATLRYSEMRMSPAR